MRTDHDLRYGTRHRRLRAQLAPLIAAGGVRCARGAECKWRELVDGEIVGGLIRAGQPWDLGHMDGADPFSYQGAEHAACNRSTSRRKEPEPAVAFRPRPDGYFEDAAGLLYRCGLRHGTYDRVSRAW